MYSRPFAAIGLGIANDDMPASSQSSLPSRSYERTRSVPAVTISVRRSFFHTNGVVQLLPSFRSARHTSAPVTVLNAAMNDWSSLSLTMYTRSPWTTGDAAGPNPLRTLMAPIGFDQRGFPFMSNAKRPMFPKYAYTRSPSVTGVSEA